MGILEAFEPVTREQPGSAPKEPSTPTSQLWWQRARQCDGMNRRAVFCALTSTLRRIGVPSRQRQVSR